MSQRLISVSASSSSSNKSCRSTPNARSWLIGQRHRPDVTGACPPAARATAVARSRCSTRAAASASSPTSNSAASTRHADQQALTYTSYEGNSWRLELAKSGVRLLVDPWLVGDLTFGGVDFMYRGVKRATRDVDVAALAAATDLIVLTMAIDDHAHRPTLQALPKSLPVLGSASAAAVARELGFQTVYELDHGQALTLCDGRLHVTGTQGALVGPPWSKRELGFVFEEAVPGGLRTYYEPHADYVPSSVAAVGQVDVAVSPPNTQSLLGAYDLVKGATDNLPLLRMLRPKVFIPLENAGFDQTGPLAAMIKESGGVQQLQAQLAADPELSDVRVAVPVPGVPLRVDL